MDLGSIRLEKLVGMVVLTLLAIGCFNVLLPFLAPILWALILVLTTWPLFLRIRDGLKGRRTLAAAAMSLLLISGKARRARRRSLLRDLREEGHRDHELPHEPRRHQGQNGGALPDSGHDRDSGSLVRA